MKSALLAIALLVCRLPAPAAVADSAPNGFTIKLSVSIKATPDEVYRRIVRSVGDWWDPAHTFSGDAHNLSIDEKPMGCFCERLKNGGGVRHLELVYFDPGKTLVFSGALGPLQTMATTGSLTISLAAEDGGTKLGASYAVGGYLAGGLNALAAPVDGVLTSQFSRLKNLIETGKP